MTKTGASIYAFLGLSTFDTQIRFILIFGTGKHRRNTKRYIRRGFCFEFETIGIRILARLGG
jgi:hypothetical protein